MAEFINAIQQQPNLNNQPVMPTAKIPTQAISYDTHDTAVDQTLRDFIETHATKLDIKVDDQTDDLIIKVINEDTGDVVKEISIKSLIDKHLEGNIIDQSV